MLRFLAVPRLAKDADLNFEISSIKIDVTWIKRAIFQAGGIQAPAGFWFSFEVSPGG